MSTLTSVTGNYTIHKLVKLLYNVAGTISQMLQTRFYNSKFGLQALHAMYTNCLALDFVLILNGETVLTCSISVCAISMFIV